jgi:O-antigen ligase
LSGVKLEEGIFKRLAKIVLITALIECAIAIPQYFVQHSLGLKGLGEPTLIGRNFLGPHFPMADGSIWIFDNFFHGVRNKAFVLRACGTLTHPNVLGGFMVFSLLMTYYLYGLGQRRVWLSLAILFRPSCFLLPILDRQFFAAALTALIWIVLTSWREKRVTTLIWVAAGSFCLSLGLLYPQMFHRGGIVSYNVVSQNSDTLRLTVQDVGIAMFKAHPFLGVGFNNYMLAFNTYAGGGALPATYIHNVYLHLGVEVGLFGVLSFLIFCLFILIKGWNSRHRPEVLTSLCIFLGFLAIGLVDFYPLCIQQGRLIFFLAAGFIAAPLSLSRMSSVKSSNHP